MTFAVLWVAIEGFKEKGKARFYLEEDLTVNYEVGDVQNGIGCEVKRGKIVVRQDPPEKVGTRRTHAPGYVI